MTDSLFGITPTAFVNGERVKQARELIGLTQSDLARKIGVTQPMVAHIEGGFKQPSEEVLSSIATVTRLPAAFFLRGGVPDLPAGWVRLSRQGWSEQKEASAHSSTCAGDPGDCN